MVPSHFGTQQGVLAGTHWGDNPSRQDDGSSEHQPFAWLRLCVSSVSGHRRAVREVTVEVTRTPLLRPVRLLISRLARNLDRLSSSADHSALHLWTSGCPLPWSLKSCPRHWLLSNAFCLCQHAIVNVLCTTCLISHQTHHFSLSLTNVS